MARKMSAVMFVLALSLSAGGCAGIHQQGVAKDSVGVIHGHQVHVGFFRPGEQGGGTYALLERSASAWYLKALDDTPPTVAAGQELLFIRSFESGAVEVSPAYVNTEIVRGSWMECDLADQAYTACNSSFVIGVPLNSRARKLDREAIASALREARVLATIDQNEASALDLQRRRERVELRVSTVQNVPRLIRLSHDDVSRLFGVEVERGATADSLAAHVYGVRPLIVNLATATVSCSASVENGRQDIRQAHSTETAVVEVRATVDSCDVEDPHPLDFVATERGGPLAVRVIGFEPRGQSTVKLSNSSSKYLKVSLLSLYYFDKIISSEVSVELAPGGEQSMNLRTYFPTTTKFENVTSRDAASKTFTFGVATKYTTGEGIAHTLLDVRQIPLSSVLPPLESD